MATATLIRDNLPDFRGHAALYRIKGGEHEYIVVSSVAVFGEPETYVFPANAAGKVIDWLEVEGSFKGGMDHSEAIRGYLAAQEN